MGNTIITPSLKDWYTVPLSKIGITISEHLEAGNFFLVFEGKDSNGKKIIIKAYEYPAPLMKIALVQAFQNYEDQIKALKSPMVGIIPYSTFYINDTMGFIARECLERDLTDIAQFQQPALKDVEKLWISYQLLRNLTGFHNKGFFHGDIKPSNIFVGKDLSVYLTDVAPFKPKFVDLKRPMVYYHFFTSNTNSAFYLAPERICDLALGNSKSIDLRKSDLFSVGCSIAYLYLNGENLFDIITIQKYIDQEYDIRSKLEAKIKDKQFVDFILKLLSVNPNDRLFTHDSLLSIFPSSFPVFYEFIKTQQERPSQDTCENTILTFIQSVFTNSSEDLKIIPFLWITNRLFHSQNAHAISSYCNFINEFCVNFDPFTKLERILPTFLTLLDFSSPYLHRVGVFSALTLIHSIKYVPIEFLNIFHDYLRPYILQLVNNNLMHRSQRNSLGISDDGDLPLSNNTFENESSDPIRNFAYESLPPPRFRQMVALHKPITIMQKDAMIVAEFLPKIMVELKRLHVPNFQEFPQNFSIFLTSADFNIFSIFIYVLQSVAPEGGYEVLSSFFYIILASFNLQDDRYKMAIFDTLLCYYRCATSYQINRYKIQCQESIVPITLDIFSRNPSQQLLPNLLSFVEYLIEHKMVDDIFCYEIFHGIIQYMYNRSCSIRILASQIINLSSPDVKEASFFSALITTRKDDVKTSSLMSRIPSKIRFYAENSLFPDSTPRFSKIHPKFIYSSFLIDPSTTKTIGISHILSLNHPSTNSTFITIDNAKRVRIMQPANFENNKLLNFNQVSTKLMPEKITAAESFPELENLVLAYQNGTIANHSYKGMRRSGELPGLKNLPAISAKRVGDSLLALGFEDGTLLIDDIRSNQIIKELKFDLSSISDLTTWPNYTLLGVGFSCGAVSIVDLRVEQPFWFIATEPVKRIFPVIPPKSSQKSSISGFGIGVISNYSAKIFEEPSHKCFQNVEGQNMFGFNFDGQPLFVDEDSCQLINLEDNKLSSRLYDNIIVNIGCKRTNLNFFEETGSTIRPGSIHKHNAPITAVIQNGNQFISGDSNGLLSCWQVVM